MADQQRLDSVVLVERSLRACLKTKSATGCSKPGRRSVLVRLRGVEPPRPCDHKDLNLARLPIPPQPRARNAEASPRREPSILRRGFLGSSRRRREISIRAGRTRSRFGRLNRRTGATRETPPTTHQRQAAPPVPGITPPVASTARKNPIMNAAHPRCSRPQSQIPVRRSPLPDPRSRRARVPQGGRADRDTLGTLDLLAPTRPDLADTPPALQSASAATKATAFSIADPATGRPRGKVARMHLPKAIARTTPESPVRGTRLAKCSDVLCALGARRAKPQSCCVELSASSRRTPARPAETRGGGYHPTILLKP